MTIDRHIVQDACHYALLAAGGSINGFEACVSGVSRSVAMRRALSMARKAFGTSELSSISNLIADAGKLWARICELARRNDIDAYTGQALQGYDSPTDDAIASYAREYHEHGSPSMAHTSMSFAVMPTREDFDRAFDAVCADTGKFEFGNDPFVGFDALNASELWRQLETQLATWNEGEHASDCPGAGDCDGSDDCPSEQAGRWCSDVLGVLGFEWI